MVVQPHGERPAQLEFVRRDDVLGVSPSQLHADVVDDLLQLTGCLERFADVRLGVVVDPGVDPIRRPIPEIRTVFARPALKAGDPARVTNLFDLQDEIVFRRRAVQPTRATVSAARCRPADERRTKRGVRFLGVGMVCRMLPLQTGCQHGAELPIAPMSID